MAAGSAHRPLNVPDDYFDTSRPAMAQGSGRHQRGLACYWFAKTLAAERDWPFGWTLVEAPGVGHDHAKMFEHERCAEALFGTELPRGAAGEGVTPPRADRAR